MSKYDDPVEQRRQNNFTLYKASLKKWVSFSFWSSYHEYVQSVTRSIDGHSQHVLRNVTQIQSESIDPWAADDLGLEYGKPIYNYSCDRTGNSYMFQSQDGLRRELIDKFTHTIISSTFITLVASFEREIKELCDRLKLCGEFDLGHSDLKHSGLDQAELYLSKVAGVITGKADNDERWIAIKHMFQIRHTIAHTGNLGGLKDAQSDWLKSKEQSVYAPSFLDFSLHQIDGYKAMLIANVSEKYL